MWEDRLRMAGYPRTLSQTPAKAAENRLLHLAAWYIYEDDRDMMSGRHDAVM
jgi:hypothetical protein